ncbi:MAG: hypothetical protein JO043_10705 [Candidatus Eremiobacteraeota bacterium]|nr:hypothetical protein [Candidatus Eremiobacteraeota bacterium]
MAQQNYGGFPSVDVLFDKDAKLVDAQSVQRLNDMVGNGGTTDLLVMSHGWNNDIPEAMDLYSRLFDRVRAQLGNVGVQGLQNRTFGIMAIFWPSKRFTSDDAIPGGAAATEDARAQQIQATLDNLADLFAERGLTAEQQEAKTLVDDLEDSESAQDRFVAIVGKLLNPAPEPDNGIDELPKALATKDGHEVLQSLQGATIGPVPSSPGGDGFDGGGAADLPDAAGDGGAAASLGTIFNTIKDAALGLLNVTTYATMKDRAGIAGRDGVAPALQQVQAAHPTLRLHLIGHSFGGRLVTGAANAISSSVATLSLLQAAYSHYGLGQNYDGNQHDGFFRNVIVQHKVTGPILISHSVNDKAVGLAYPIASRILNQQASALGDENDPFGGMGRNGAQKTPEVPDPNGMLGAAGTAYTLSGGVPNNLNGDSIIQSHGDICRDELAYVILCAVGKT